MRPSTGVAALVAGLVAVTSACGAGSDGAEGAAGRGEVTVLASFYPLAEAAERVGGDAVSVENLTPAGSEPHELELTPTQVEAIGGADVVVVMGRGFQPGVEAVAEEREGATVEVLSALEVGEGRVADEDHEDEGGLDPHVWLDPTKMAQIVDAVASALTRADPDRAEDFQANAEAYRRQLSELDAAYEASLGSCDRDLLVVAHDAFGWLAERYGLQQEPIAGLSPEQEPDPQRLAELVAVVEREGVTTVFTETLVAPAVAETLAREAGVDTAVLDPLEGLTEERLADGETYLSVMEANLAKLEDALGC
jgi:zinc transport system substrate-binding protein